MIQVTIDGHLMCSSGFAKQKEDNANTLLSYFDLDCWIEIFSHLDNRGSTAFKASCHFFYHVAHHQSDKRDYRKLIPELSRLIAAKSRKIPNSHVPSYLLPSSIAVTEDGQLRYGQDTHGQIGFLNPKSKQLISIANRNDQLSSLIALKNKKVAAGFSNGNISIIHEGKHIALPKEHDGAILALDSLVDKRMNELIVSASTDGTLKIWNVSGLALPLRR